MDDLLLHHHTRELLTRFLNKPSQPLLLAGPPGSGKGTIAQALARAILRISAGKSLSTVPAVITISPKAKSISIDEVRSLQQRLQLKTIGKDALKRVVLIEDAHLMTTEAQNALLKLLEEPPQDTVLILTAPSRRNVLPTIASRTQFITIKEPLLQESTDYFSKLGFTKHNIEQALRYSGNRLGLAAAILKHDEKHPLVESVAEARSILLSPLTEKLQQVDIWIKQKDQLPDRLDALGRICYAGLRQSAKQPDSTAINRWKHYYEVVYDTQANLSYTPNLKLLLTRLFLELS